MDDNEVKEEEKKEDEKEKTPVETLLEEARKMMETLTAQNEKLASELKEVKDVNLKLAKSMPAETPETFESAIAGMFDLKGGEKH